MKRGMNIRPFATELRAHGFVKDYDTRGGGVRTVGFYLIVGDRKVEVHLWGNGKHTVSHFLNGRMSTPPTSFSDVASMKLAIKHELTRTDHPEPIGPRRK